MRSLEIKYRKLVVEQLTHAKSLICGQSEYLIFSIFTAVGDRVHDISKSLFEVLLITPDFNQFKPQMK